MPARKHQDDAIAQALCSSVSVADAARKLGMSTSNLESRCRSEGLTQLYEKCAARGSANRGPRRRRPKLPSWGIFWTPPGAEPVRVWGIEAEDGGQALTVAARVVPLFIRRDQLSAVEEIR